MIPIDLSTELVEKMLQWRFEKHKVAMKALYSGGNAAEAFRDIIPDVMPKGITEAELRHAGIADWGDFKELWDDKLAKEVAMNM